MLGAAAPARGDVVDAAPGTEGGLARAIDAADRVFDNPRAQPVYEPQGAAEVSAAVGVLSDRFRAGGGTLKEIIENARAAAEVLSEDPFQALSEIIQNADDAAATCVGFTLRGGALVIAHDGRPLRLRDAHALAAPWLTTKQDDSAAVGRFGIGLMTLNALADSFEMHSGDYHVRFGAPTLDVVPPRTAPNELRDAGGTLLYLKLRDPGRAAERLLDWASRWDDSALLFLRSVHCVNFTVGSETRSLGLTWPSAGDERHAVSSGNALVRCRNARTGDGRVWSVYDAEFGTPEGIKRAHKATDETTPVAVAVSLSGRDEGMLYAGLPITAVDLPLRANAQFDPIASRQGVATNDWNFALVSMVADLWCHAVVQLFREKPEAAWCAIPITSEKAPRSEVIAKLHESLLAVARSSVADSAEIDLLGSLHWVGDLAHEVPELEGRLTDDEIAQLANLNAALSGSARDSSGRWRLVLDDWRQAGNDIAKSVTIRDALRLLDDTNLAAERTLSLGAIALAGGLERELAFTKCIIKPDGSRSTPPRSASLNFLVTARTGLAVELALGTSLHECHLADSPDAQAVLAWLVRRRSIVPSDGRAVLSRLAEAGSSGVAMSRRLDETQLVVLRDALEGLGQAEWTELGPAIGKAIRIEGFQYDHDGHQIKVDARPSTSYIGRSIDKDPNSFAVAADKTTGLVWVASRYATILQSSLGRQGLGALRFLRLLGAETAPRVAPHPALERKYGNSARRGLRAWCTGTPTERGRAISALGGDYTLDDTCNPDLEKVLRHIAADPKAKRRRLRAAALIATLGRAWSGLGNQSEVMVAQAYYSWNQKGVIRAWWLWAAATIAWLDDDSGEPRRPIDLRLRTPATLALHRTDATGFVHRTFQEARPDVLDALGVAGEPSTAELCDGLGQLRDSPNGRAVDGEAAVLYRAIAEHLGNASHTRGDLTPDQLRKRFADGTGLVHTNLGWRQPSDVFTGRPIFGNRAPFAPAISGTDRLWKALRLKPPRTTDCISLLASIGQEGDPPDPATQTILLETLRELVVLREQSRPSDSEARKLARLPLWTTSGWTSKRPVLAVFDPVLAAGLARTVPVWKPGGEMSQFVTLISPLRLTEVPASAGEVVGGARDVDEDLTELLRSAIGLLHDDLVRNDPVTASSLSIPWLEFENFDVAVNFELRVRVSETSLPAGLVEVAVNAKAASDQNCVYVADGDLLGRLDGGGRAIAGLFNADHRRVAQAWLAAVEGATAHREAEGLRLAEERAVEERRRNDARIEGQTRAMQQQVNERRKSSKQPRAANGPRHKPSSQVAPNGGSPTPRNLVEPSRLQIVKPEGEIVGDPTPSPPQRSNETPPLREPTRGGTGPQQRSRVRGYTDLEKESIGLQLARQVLERDDEAMTDLRAQRGVGADAIDELDQFYELKVYAGSEPDEIRLTDSEVRRALACPEFFLVVVSGVEEDSAEHKVRIVAQPLQQLHKLDHRDMRLGGVRKVRSLVYRLVSET